MLTATLGEAPASQPFDPEVQQEIERQRLLEALEQATASARQSAAEWEAAARKYQSAGTAWKVAAGIGIVTSIMALGIDWWIKRRRKR